jgi:hypothetical protein
LFSCLYCMERFWPKSKFVNYLLAFSSGGKGLFTLVY